MTEKNDEVSYNLGAGEKVLSFRLPVVIDARGRVIDGLHRLDKDKTWPKIVMSEVDDDLKYLIAKVKSHQRRQVKPEEWSALFNGIAKILVEQRGVHISRIAHEVSEETGEKMWSVYRYLDKKYMEPRTPPSPRKRPDGSEAPEEPLPDVKSFRTPMPPKGSPEFNDKVIDMINSSIGQPVSSILAKLLSIFHDLTEAEAKDYIEAYRRERASIWNISYDLEGNPIKRAPAGPQAPPPPLTDLSTVKEEKEVKPTGGDPSPGPPKFETDPLFDELERVYPSEVLLEYWDKVPDSKKLRFFKDFYLECWRVCPDRIAAATATIKKSG